MTLGALARVACRGALAASAAATGVSAAAELPRTAPQQWLEATHTAFRELDYDGVFTYYTLSRAQQLEFSRSSEINGASGQGGADETSFARRETRTLGFGIGYRTIARVATFRVVHKVVDGVERERIVQLDGPPREILRTGDEVSYVLPSGDELLALRGTAPARPYDRVFGRRFEDIGDIYQVRIVGRYREAARPAVLLSVTPRHRDRFGYRLWVDEETGLLLRSEQKDSQGTDLEIFKFTSLRIGDAVAESDLRPATEGAVVSRPSEPAAAPPVASNWRAQWVPPGFRLTSAAVRPQLGDSEGATPASPPSRTTAAPTTSATPRASSASTPCASAWPP